MSSLPKDLNNFLFMVPFVSSKPKGVSVDELCEKLGITEKELTKLIDNVIAVGAPDGTPDEMVDVYIEENRVHVDLPQRFTRPPRFSVEEMLALLLVLGPLRQQGLPALAEQASELSERLLGLASQRASELRETLSSKVQVHTKSSDSTTHLALLEEAVLKRLRIEGEYFTASRDEMTSRTLEPCALLQNAGAWYLLNSDAKKFKVERFKSLSLKAETFEPPEGLDIELHGSKLFAKAPEHTVTLSTDGVKSSRAVTAQASLFRYIQSQRGRVILNAPEEWRSALVEETRQILSRYSD